MKARILMWVQTRFGLGHLTRAMHLCNALARRAHDVTLVHGGMPIPMLKPDPAVAFVQLPPAQAPDLKSSSIRDEYGNEVDEVWRQGRIEALRAAIIAAKPHVIITETFPFGRPIFHFEWLPILADLDTFKPRPLMVASVRDILQRPSDPERAQRMAGLAMRYFDLVLSHGDERIGTVLESFPEAALIADRIIETGYLHPYTERKSIPRSGVIVTAGGGRTGQALFEAAIAAFALRDFGLGPWTLVAGPFFETSNAAWSRTGAPPGLTIVGAIPDLAARFHAANLVIGQCGYNTVVETLAAGARMITVPNLAFREREQTIRAERLHALGLLHHLPLPQLTAQSLGEAIDTIKAIDPPAFDLRMDDGSAAGTALEQLLKRRFTL
ncbi:MAG TPA: hypothetical protein DCL54_09720 [Alphaproteobacteria bacterium]|nr:hypothetical protein [Alphaproteobacteria bacterium]